jgi:hypothetical protein
MRRFCYALAACAGLLCGLTGCNLTSGVCDCDIEEDPCAVRAPWYKAPAPQTPTVTDKLPSKL